MLGQDFSSLSHHHLRHGTKESVAVHAVDQVLIAQTVSPARFEVVRNPRHGFGPARENAARIAESNGLVSQRDRFHPRGAGFVHGKRRRFLWHAAADGNLPRYVRSAARLPRAAEDSFFHLLGLDSSALDRSLRGYDADAGGRERSQRPAE